jgi:transposase
VNQLRAFLLERGLTVRKGRSHLWSHLPEIMADVEGLVSPRLFRIILSISQQWRELEERIQEVDEEISAIAVADDSCRRLQTVPGVGPLIAIAMVAAIGNGSAFSKGRHFSAWLGLIPQQRSTGGHIKLSGITKRGNEYLRRLFIHGARSVAFQVKRDRHAFGPWITALQNRAHSDVVSVALANKLARIAWSVLNMQDPYGSSYVAVDT